ncbi:MAG TPA: hypothetical protein VGL99_10860 [Chloroflexota bacterium]
MQHHASEVTFDLTYTWGLPPSAYLAMRQVVRLTILRSRLADDRLALRNRQCALPQSTTEE